MIDVGRALGPPQTERKPAILAGCLVKPNKENDRMSPIRHGISIFAIVSMALASACSGAQPKQSLEVEATETVADSATPPPENIEQLAERVLTLLEHARTPADLSLLAIQRHMGLHMRPIAGDASLLEATGRLGGTWTYSLATVRSSYRVAPHALRLRLDDGRDGMSDMSPVCRFDYEQYKSSLERIGFKSRVIMGSQRQVNFNHDSGSGLHVIARAARECHQPGEEMRGHGADRLHA
jgi:hypothetical protein